MRVYCLLILGLVQHNDNSGNAYSDVFWLASVIESIGSLEFGKQVQFYSLCSLYTFSSLKDSLSFLSGAL